MLSNVTPSLLQSYRISRYCIIIGLNGSIPTPVKSLLDVLQKNLARAERDNDLIYHKDVPPASSITPIQAVIMVQSNLLSGLSDPRSMMGSGRVLFGELLSWGAREAIGTWTLVVAEFQYSIWS